jgi:hypothetical protein
MEESPIYNRYNTDDIFNRSVIGGLIYLMNNQVTYEQIWENNIVEIVSVPCAFDMVNSDNERFLQDNYTFFGKSCFGDKKIDGKFDMLPRTLLRYTGSNIDANNITNRFIKGTYLKNENGKLTSYTAFMYCIPISMSFECETWFDSLDTGFKIEQAIRETFYKNKTYNVLYKGIKVGCRVGFPEQTTIEKSVSFAFDSERQHKLKFNLSVECYQPCFDNATAIETDKKINYIGVDYSFYNNNITPKDKNVELEILSPVENSIILSDTLTKIVWYSKSNVSDVCTVSLSYILDNHEYQIATPLYNQDYYDWYIPSSLSNYIQPDITYLNIEQNNIINKAEIKVIPDNKKEFSESSFVILNPGLYAGITEIPFMLEYIDSKGNTISSSYDDPYKFIINDQKVVSIYAPKTKLKYKNKIKYTNITLKLTYTTDRSIYTKRDNILVI